MHFFDHGILSWMEPRPTVQKLAYWKASVQAAGWQKKLPAKILKLGPNSYTFGWLSHWLDTSNPQKNILNSAQSWGNPTDLSCWGKRKVSTKVYNKSCFCNRNHTYHHDSPARSLQKYNSKTWAHRLRKKENVNLATTNYPPQVNSK